MFSDFFYTLRERKVPVSITEWMALMDALSKGCVSNMNDFYYVARSILVKSEAHYDQYDLAFQQYFRGAEAPLPDITDQILEWLKDPFNRLLLTPEERALLESMSLEELMRELEKRLQEQTEQHDGGSYWIGRGGTSPFGHSGQHPGGIRVGGGGGGRSAIKIAEARRFRNYRHDLTLDVRQIKVALTQLRQLNRVGPEELDLESTIDATCKNAGELEFIWRKSRKNAVKLLLLMDVGGSMEPFAHLCSLLFSAAHSSSHFKDFKYYYFHNCVYDVLYKDIERRDRINVNNFLRNMEPDYKVVLVGDATMAVQELTDRYGAIYYYQRTDTPGIIWLKRVAEHFTHSVWLNPETQNSWNHPTVQMTGKLFPMFELTLDGLVQAAKKLVVKK
jgi:uncharacterized protein with von Willebrand factor type A (vWA) domain